MTYDQIYALAPDTDTLQKARGVSYAGRKWLMIEGNEKLLWASYQTAPNLLHRVVADLERQQFGCTCSSIQRPCRHALGLLMLLLRHDERIRVSYEPPEWVFKWKENQGRITAKQAPASAAPSSERINAQRYQAMQAGIIELKQWLRNLVRQGLAVAREQPPDFWDSFAARMVDAKLGSIARQIRLAKSLLTYEDWPDHLLGLIGDLYLFAQSFQRLELLPEPLQDELMSYGGVNIKKELVLARKGLFDHWLVIGQVFGEEEQLRYRRTWLLGEKSQQSALLLDFVFGQAPYEHHWPVGAALQGEIAFYPASQPQRALVKDFVWSQKAYQGLSGYTVLEEFALNYAKNLAINPWLLVFPGLLDDVIPILEADRLYLVDRHQKKIPVFKDSTASWKLLALSGGHPISVFGEWNGEYMIVLTGISEGRVVAL